ncbi:MAG: polysaccharide pyruvyl transferase family protein [Candidatus Omnitrophota bacterium]|nr:polysaccharide pyruvyl transferase family protein [bacterium]
MTKKIFAAGYFGYGNFGDELIRDIFISRMSAWSISSIPRMKTKPLSVFLSIAKSDAVVFPGGSVFQDETSTLSLFFYACVIFASALLSKPVFLLDSGFEVRKPLNKAILRMALKLTAFISVRDSASFELLRALGLNPFKSADCACSLKNFPCRHLVPPKTIGVIPRRKTGEVKEAISLCQKKWPGAKFKFAVLSPGDMPSARYLAGGGGGVLIKDMAGAEKFFAGCDFFILTPFHSLVLATVSGADFTAVTYSDKTANFMKDMDKLSSPNKRNRAELPRIAEECAFQIFLNLLKDKLKL